MIVILPIHSLHLVIMVVWIINMKEFKNNITIKNGWNVRNIFDMECIVIQFFQLQGVMGGKRHCFQAIHDTEKRKGESFETTCKKDLNGTLETLWFKSEELEGCIEIGNVLAMLKESHKFMNVVSWFEVTPITSSLTWKSWAMTLTTNAIVPNVKIMS